MGISFISCVHVDNIPIFMETLKQITVLFFYRVPTNGGHSLPWLWIGIPVLAVILLSAIICYFVWRRKGGLFLQRFSPVWTAIQTMVIGTV